MAVLTLGHEVSPAQGLAFHDRLDRLGVPPQGRPGFCRVVGHHGIEVLAGHHVAVAGQAGHRGPRELETTTKAVRAQPLVAVAGSQFLGQAHVLELAH